MNDILIPADWDFALWSVIIGLAALAFWLESTKASKYLSGVALIVLGAIFLSNANIIPNTAPAYDMVWSFMVPFAIPLLLFKADLRRIIPETKGMMIIFLFGAVGTALGAIIGFYLLPLGSEAAKLVGVFSATYIGGSMNMAAVSEAVNIDSSLVASSVAADNVVSAIFIAFLAFMPALSVFRRVLPCTIVEKADEQMEQELTQPGKLAHLNLVHISAAMFLSLVICTASYEIAAAFSVPGYSILFVTALTVLIANVFPAQLAKLEGDFEVGMLMMYVFFAVVGAGADIGQMIDSGMVIVGYAVLIVVFHFIFAFAGAWFFKLDLAELVTASNACILGPTTAAALAAGKRWNDLVTPALMLGVFGYVIANFIGVMLAGALS